MTNDKEKIEDFMTLWNKKSSQESKPSIIGETISQLESLKKENDELRQKIAENIELISKSENVIRNLSNDRERVRIENEETIMDLTMRLNNLENENTELGNKVKSMVKLLMEKDDQIKKLEVGSIEANSSTSEEFKAELSKKNEKIELLTKQISDLNTENENLQAQLLEKIKEVPTFVVPVEKAEDKILKPLPPESSGVQPLEILCQDLQSDLNKYKRIIDQMNQEKTQLKQALEQKGIEFNLDEINTLKNENELLRNDLQKLQESISTNRDLDTSEGEHAKIVRELQEKLVEKEKIIADLKLSQIADLSDTKGPMTDLIEELQKNINKLKLIIQEKDQKITELTQLINP